MVAYEAPRRSLALVATRSVTESLSRMAVAVASHFFMKFQESPSAWNLKRLECFDPDLYVTSGGH
jgi:hypothetical protein